ncbi:hypothetical protein NQ315_009087 [Exocentrus adspersus]|uniref:N-acetyltransferase domain-containing protein n=1 Tax=Exocentrus adspersus TaxID=1586481 RepID=A0AAV8WFG1_9CUCU|nr:hypothetical protein NQ315_009087 [Exocentrus adspersus]
MPTSSRAIMPECHNEILMNIADEDLERLAEMYKEHGEIPYASSVLINGIRVRKKRNFYVRFMSPGLCWREDGTFFAVIEFPHCYDLAVFTLDRSCKNVYEGLMKTKRLHFTRPIVFYAVHNTVYSMVKKVLEEKNLQIKSNKPHHIFTISVEKAQEFKIDVPDQVELRRLSPLHAKTIDPHWPERFQNSEELLSTLIELVGGLGLFMKSNNELVSWAILSEIGQLGFIQTLESYQKKGYAGIITKALCKKIAGRGENPTATVPIDDAVSQSMFKKLGFENQGQCNYITVDSAV